MKTPITEPPRQLYEAGPLQEAIDLLEWTEEFLRHILNEEVPPWLRNDYTNWDLSDISCIRAAHARSCDILSKLRQKENGASCQNAPLKLAELPTGAQIEG